MRKSQRTIWLVWRAGKEEITGLTTEGLAAQNEQLALYYKCHAESGLSGLTARSPETRFGCKHCMWEVIPRSPRGVRECGRDEKEPVWVHP